MRKLFLLLVFSFLLLKNGNCQKQFIYGDSLANEKGIVSHQLADGTIWVIGSGVEAGEVDMDIIAFKIDTGGNVLSTFLKYGTTNLEYPNNMIYRQGKFIIAGEQHNSNGVDGFILVLDSLGNQESFQAYGLPNQTEQFYDIKPTSDGGFVVGGFSSSGSGNDFLIGKFDSSHQLEWLKTHDLGSNDIGVTVIENPNGGYLIAGDQRQPLNNYNVVVLAVDSLGNALWDQFVSSPFNGGCKAMINLGNDVLIVGEMSTSTSSSFDIYLVRMDWSGNVKWQKAVPKTNSGDACFDAYLNHQNEVILTGYVYSTATNSTDMFAMAVDSSGNLLTEQYFHHSNFEMGYDVKPNIYGGFILTGFTKNINTGADEFFVALPDIGTTVSVLQKRKEVKVNQIFPNPTKNKVFLSDKLQSFELSVIDSQGRKQNVIRKNNQITLSHLPIGIYIFLFKDENGKYIYSQKILKN